MRLNFHTQRLLYISNMKILMATWQKKKHKFISDMLKILYHIVKYDIIFLCNFLIKFHQHISCIRLNLCISFLHLPSHYVVMTLTLQKNSQRLSPF